MSLLIGYLRVGEGPPGLGIPVFRAYPGANSTEIQIIDSLGGVRGFQQYDLANHERIAPCEQRDVEIGQQALWIVEISADELLLGTPAELKDILFTAHKEFLSNHPLLATEIYLLVGEDISKGNLLKNAYKRYKSYSPRGADLWRDYNILLPVAKAELCMSAISERSRRDIIRHTRVTCRDRVCLVEVPSGSISKGVSLLKTSALLDQFDLDELALSETTPDSDYLEIEPSRWPIEDCTVIGLGGLGRFALEQNPFNKLAMTAFLAAGQWAGQVCGGWSDFGGKARAGEPALFVVFGSDRPLAKVACSIAHRDIAPTTITAAIVIRPISFGEPGPAKFGFEEIRELSDDFDLVWVVSGHRLQRTTGILTGLATSRDASRLAKRVITTFANEQSVFRRLIGRSDGGQVALIGQARREPYTDLRQTIRDAVRATLSMEFSVATARIVYAFCPAHSTKRGMVVKVTLGKSAVSVRVRESKRTSQEVVVVAVGVEQPSDRESWLADITSCLLVAYGWKILSFTPLGILASIHGSNWLIVTTTGKIGAKSLVRRSDSTNRAWISSQSVSKSVKDRSKNCLHYSEIARWTARLRGATEYFGAIRFPES